MGENPIEARKEQTLLEASRSTVAPVEHPEALPCADLPRFMTDLRQRDSLSAPALEFKIVTAARTCDTVGALQDEVARQECPGTFRRPA